MDRILPLESKKRQSDSAELNSLVDSMLVKTEVGNILFIKNYPGEKYRVRC